MRDHHLQIGDGIWPVFSNKIDVFWNQKVAATYVAKVRIADTTLASSPSIMRSNAENTENRSQKIKSKKSASP